MAGKSDQCEIESRWSLCALLISHEGNCAAWFFFNELYIFLSFWIAGILYCLKSTALFASLFNVKKDKLNWPSLFTSDIEILTLFTFVLFISWPRLSLATKCPKILVGFFFSAKSLYMNVDNAIHWINITIHYVNCFVLLTRIHWIVVKDWIALFTVWKTGPWTSCQLFP